MCHLWREPAHNPAVELPGGGGRLYESYGNPDLWEVVGAAVQANLFSLYLSLLLPSLTAAVGDVLKSSLGMRLKHVTRPHVGRNTAAILVLYVLLVSHVDAIVQDRVQLQGKCPFTFRLVNSHLHLPGLSAHSEHRG